MEGTSCTHKTPRCLVLRMTATDCHILDSVDVRAFETWHHINHCNLFSTKYENIPRARKPPISHFGAVVQRFVKILCEYIMKIHFWLSYNIYIKFENLKCNRSLSDLTRNHRLH